MSAVTSAESSLVEATPILTSTPDASQSFIIPSKDESSNPKTQEPTKHEAMTASEAAMMLLRSPKRIAQQCTEERNLESIVIASLVLTVVGSAIFGGVLGSYRGGLQILYSAIKLPLSSLLTLVVCAPAFHALVSTLGTPRSLRSAVALILSGVARASLVLAATAPMIWLALDWGVGYHGGIMCAAVSYGISGLVALSVLMRGFQKQRFLVGLIFSAVFLMTFAQTTWSLRPYLGRPQHKVVPFVRAPEGSFADAISRAARSSAGVYERSEAPSSKQSRDYDIRYTPRSTR